MLRSPRRRRSRSVLLLPPLLLLLPMLCGGCDDAPTAPSFPFAGRWVGMFYDHSVLFINGSPVTGTLTIEIAPDGSATGTGRREYEVGPNQKLTDQVVFTLEVMPDGAVTGTGEWGYSAPWGADSREGTVTGQFDRHMKCGDGVLEWEVQGAPWHLPWHVEKVKN